MVKILMYYENTKIVIEANIFFIKIFQQDTMIIRSENIRVEFFFF